MPIYAYRCSSCGHAKDVLQKLSDPVVTQCPSCGASTFVKQVTAAGFQLKGSGWYVTDFRGDKKPGSGGAESGEAGSGASEKGDKGEKGEKADKGEQADKGDAAKKSEAPATGKSDPSSAGAPAPAAGPSAPSAGSK